MSKGPIGPFAMCLANVPESRGAAVAQPDTDKTINSVTSRENGMRAKFMSVPPTAKYPKFECAVQGAVSQRVRIPPGNFRFRPVATGAIVEVTKQLKPLV